MGYGNQKIIWNKPLFLKDKKITSILKVKFVGLWHEVLNFYWLLNCPIWPVQLQVFAIGQVKSDSLDLKQPIKPQIRAVKN